MLPALLPPRSALWQPVLGWVRESCAQADTVRRASRRHTCGAGGRRGASRGPTACVLRAAGRPGPGEDAPLGWAPLTRWGSPRWNSVTAVSTARTSERRSSRTKRSWTRPTNSSRSSSRTGSPSSVRSRVSAPEPGGEGPSGGAQLWVPLPPAGFLSLGL